MFIKDLSQQLKKLADTGVTGSSREWVSDGLRVFPYKKRCFYFRIDGNEMIVLRVLHQRQDTAVQNFPDL